MPPESLSAQSVQGRRPMKQVFRRRPFSVRLFPGDRGRIEVVRRLLSKAEEPITVSMAIATLVNEALDARDEKARGTK